MRVRHIAEVQDTTSADVCVLLARWKSMGCQGFVGMDAPLLNLSFECSCQDQSEREAMCKGIWWAKALDSRCCRTPSSGWEKSRPSFRICQTRSWHSETDLQTSCAGTCSHSPSSSEPQILENEACYRSEFGASCSWNLELAAVQ